MLHSLEEDVDNRNATWNAGVETALLTSARQMYPVLASETPTRNMSIKHDCVRLHPVKRLNCTVS